MTSGGDGEPPLRRFGLNSIRRKKMTATKTRRIPDSPDPPSPDTESPDHSTPAFTETPVTHTSFAAQEGVAAQGDVAAQGGDETFNPPQRTTHCIRDIIRSKFDAPYLSWKKIPMEVRDMWFCEFERSFRWLPENNNLIRRNFERRGSTRLRDMFTDLRKSGQRPHWLGEAVWAGLQSAWASPEFVRKREQNKINRASDCDGASSSRHTGGSIPSTEIRRRLAKSLNREPTLVELYSHTHHSKDKEEWIDDRSHATYDTYQNLQSQTQEQQSDSVDTSQSSSEYDTWLKAIGGKKKNRAYGLGAQGKKFDMLTSYVSSPASSSGDPTAEDRYQRQEKEIAEMKLQQARESAEMQELKQKMQEMQQTMDMFSKRFEDLDEEDEDTD